MGANSPYGMMCHDDMTLFRHNGDSVTNRHSDRVTKGALIAPEIATMRLDIPASSVGANGPYGMMCREDMTLSSHQGKRPLMRQAMTPDRIAILRFSIPETLLFARDSSTCAALTSARKGVTCEVRSPSFGSIVR